jgi:hypothetical protein
MTTKPVLGRELGMALCQILNLPPDETQSLTIQIDPHQVVTVTIIHRVTPVEAEGIADLIHHYRLVPRDEP